VAKKEATMSGWWRVTAGRFEQMFDRLAPDLGRRQLRLLACALCRWLDHQGRYTAVIELAERFADGRATAHELAAARFGGRFRAGHPAWAVCWGPEQDALTMARRAAQWVAGLVPTDQPNAGLGPTHILFDIAAGPRTQVSPAILAWSDGVVVKLAQTIYAERAFERMPILGDALEDAGCTDQAILEHLRGPEKWGDLEKLREHLHSPGAHVRGCWVLELILHGQRPGASAVG
jgi:hypothetical protein